MVSGAEKMPFSWVKLFQIPQVMVILMGKMIELLIFIHIVGIFSINIPDMFMVIFH